MSIGAIAAICYLLTRSVPAAAELYQGVRAPHAWLAQVGPDAAAASLAGALLWLATLWLAAGLAASLLSLLPGRCGGIAGAIARRAMPAAMRKVVCACTGASLLLSPLSAAAAGPIQGTGATAGPAQSTRAANGPAPSWPMDQPAPSRPTAPAWPTDSVTGVGAPPGRAGAPASTVTSAAPVWPSTTGHPTGTQQPEQPPVTIEPPRTSTPSEAAEPPTATPPTATPTPSQRVTVAPGDSLWLIAANRLGPAASDGQIAVEWPYWYWLNRDAIGSNPGLLRPGTELAVPQDVRRTAGS
ncbi:MAG: LysM peptidoglycan-binding domain-containing protein [Jatrophihabitans sp.]